jgi:hypothetical protein
LPVRPYSLPLPSLPSSFSFFLLVPSSSSSFLSCFSALLLFLLCSLLFLFFLLLLLPYNVFLLSFPSPSSGCSFPVPTYFLPSQSLVQYFFLLDLDGQNAKLDELVSKCLLLPTLFVHVGRKKQVFSGFLSYCTSALHYV